MPASSSRIPSTHGAAAHRGSPIAPSTREAVRAFYQDVLGGREVWPTQRADSVRCLWFLVDGTLIQARAGDADRPVPIVLEVDSPEAIAERCWDAGFLVQVRTDSAGGTALSVIDPFGQRIDLAVRMTGQRRSALSHAAPQLVQASPERRIEEAT